MKTSLAPLSIARLSPTELYSGASKTVEYYFEFETHAPTHRRKALGPWAVAAVLFFTGVFVCSFHMTVSPQPVLAACALEPPALFLSID